MASAMKVSVGCKLPNGLVVTHKDITVEFVGANDARAVGGFGITRNVDPDWFKSWAATDAVDFVPLKTGALFIMPDAKVEDAAEERSDDATVRTGLEPIDPENPGGGVEPTDAQKTENAKIDPKAKG